VAQGFQKIQEAGRRPEVAISLPSFTTLQAVQDACKTYIDPQAKMG
jgi:hypothetical protein